MVCCVFHNDTQRATITNKQLRQEIDEVLPAGWDVVERCDTETSGMWPFRNRKVRTWYSLYYYVGAGFGDWQVVMCVGSKETLLSFLAGFSAGQEGKQ